MNFSKVTQINQIVKGAIYKMFAVHNDQIIFLRIFSFCSWKNMTNVFWLNYYYCLCVKKIWNVQKENLIFHSWVNFCPWTRMNTVTTFKGHLFEIIHNFKKHIFFLNTKMHNFTKLHVTNTNITTPQVRAQQTNP